MDVTVGTVVAGRYVVEARAGAGGMGVVYRARDRVGDRIVALKLLRAQADDPARRFAREAWLLSDLAHPGIVRYVDHGQADDGSLYLAMEWLDGEDLATRLARSPLALPDALALARRVADALAAAHERGIVHRDLKPSNLFLVGGAASAAVVLDFGLARLTAGMSTVTVQGTLMGTPGYMAPEQVRCEASLGPPADLFALGCVLYECIAGRSPFPGDRPWARLAKILFEEPQPLTSRRPEVPPALDDLVRTLLAKDPRERLADGRELTTRLAAIAVGPGPVRSRATSITDDEVRLVSVVVAAAPPAAGTADPDVTITGNQPVSTISDRGARLHRLAADHGGRVEQLPQGLAIATLVGRGTATDAATQAARCALEMRALLPDTRIVLTTGRAAYSGTWPVGTTIDRAADLLGDGGDAAVVVDPATAGLLDGRFEIVATPAGLVLGAERAAAGRTLLGRPSPFVGRDRELAALEALMAAALDEPAARAVVVTGDAGIGKSRLWAEAAPRLTAARPDAEVWIARGDPTSAGASFGLIAQLVRRAAGVGDGAPLGERQAAVEALVERRLPVADRARVAAFLGELVGAPFADAGRDQLAAARQDPLRMGDQVRRAWEDLVAAAAAAHPLVVIVEDLHWGDLPSVKLLDAALRHAGALPLVVVGLARPDVHRLFPALWAERRRDELHLGALPRRGAADLVRSALGADTGDDTVDALVERAEGNAFFLEELIRAAAEGRTGAPETVVAMVQARLDALDGALRRVLRAASIYGQISRPAGIAAALGVPAASRALAAWLAALRDKELLTERREADAVVYAFRHALVRDAVYQSLTAADRALGHRLAADWLEAEGHGDPLALADHLEHGGEPARAIAWLERAAHQALEGNDFTAALACVDRGIACGATGETLGGLLTVALQSRIWRGELAEAEVMARRALELLPGGRATRYRTLGRLAWLLGQQQRSSEIMELLAQLEQCPDDTAAEAMRQIAFAQAAVELRTAARAEAEPILARLQKEILSALSPYAKPWLLIVRTFDAARRRDLSQAHDLIADAASEFHRLGDERLACLNRINKAYLATELGEYESAETELRAALQLALRQGLHHNVAMARNNLGLVLLRRLAVGEALLQCSEAAESFQRYGNSLLEANARIYMSEILRRRGELQAAKVAADRACALLREAPGERPQAHAELALVLLARGENEAALRMAQQAVAGLEVVEGVKEGEFQIRCAHIQALLAAGRSAEAFMAATHAKERLLREAARLSDPRRRALFLEAVPAHASIIALASGSAVGDDGR
jgi:tetratricopeptide (TPR) repeat protein